MNRVFISYRREIGSTYVKKIYDVLIKDYRVFYDKESLGSGRFDAQIEEAIKGSKDFLLLVTSNLFNSKNEKDDVLYHEIETALEYKLNIIPIFIEVDDFPINCPEHLKDVKMMNGLFFEENDSFYHKLKSFIISNPLKRLSIDYNGKQFVLTQEAYLDLIDVYQEQKRKKNYEVEVELKFKREPDTIEEYVLEGYEEYSKQIIQELILHRIVHYQYITERLIECVLKDENMSSYATNMQYYYTNSHIYDIDTFTSVGEYGEHTILFVPMLWIDIINEALKNISFDRVHQSLNMRSSLSLDVFINRYKWYFVTHVPYDGNEGVVKELMDYVGATVDITRISVPYRFTTVVVDLYMALLSLKNNKEDVYEDLMKNKNILDLFVYEIGLH